MKTSESKPGSEKVRSPHPKLQSVLPRLAGLNPSHKQKPIFEDRSEAELFVELYSDEEGDILLTPVWAIDHNDLESSRIRAWSVSSYPC